jgi:hypothetical protein
MKLDDFAGELVAANKFVKAGFGGMAGAGKSRTATEFVIGSYKDLEYTKPVLYIDNEKGSRFLIPKFKEAGIPVRVKDTTSLQDVLTAFDFLRNGEISYLFIDSLSKVWYRYVRQYMEDNRRKFMELSDWGKILPAWQETFADRFVAADGSIVFTGRGGFSYEKEEDETDERTGKVKKGQFVKSGVKMKVAGETPFEPDLNLWMEQHQEMGSDGLTIWREAQVMKDRSGIIDGKTFRNPTYADLRPFVQYLCAVPTGTVRGESDGGSLAPSENFEGFDRKRKKEIALEEIQAEIVKLHPSSSAEDKKAKAELVEELFHTRSWTAVENKPLEVLERARDALWVKSRGHGYGKSAALVGESMPAGPNESAGAAVSNTTTEKAA